MNPRDYPQTATEVRKSPVRAALNDLHAKLDTLEKVLLTKLRDYTSPEVPPQPPMSPPGFDRALGQVLAGERPQLARSAVCDHINSANERVSRFIEALERCDL